MDFTSRTDLSISLVLPVRNSALYLKRCLASLSDCGYGSMENVEIVIVDNGSETSEIHNVCNLFRGIKYVYESRQGKARALNCGIKAASGSYIAFTDADVVLKDAMWLNRLRRNFEGRSEVGYVSGNVVAYELKTEAQRMWETKGGLSKGQLRREFDGKFFKQKRLSGVPIRLIAAGANCMIPKHVIEEVGYFDELFGPGSPVPHAESLEICYKVLRQGYTAVYDPEAVVYHSHPASVRELRKKLFIYGIGDTAVHTKFLIRYGDSRSLFEILYARQFQVVHRLLLSLVGHYPLPPDILIAQMAGNFLGPLYYFRSLLSSGRGLRTLAYE